MEAVVTSVIAVLGTLLGAVVAGTLQHRLAREARAGELRRERLTALTGLIAALADHRRAMWAREDMRLRGADAASYEQARAASHATRSTITAPLTAVQILAPVLADRADAAARAVYGLRHAADADMLTARREEAIEAAERLVKAAATVI